ncbi:MAG: sigma-70 family RNA polymerase sigma factor [bacterium]|nr:sigma-70 family RNA polymerase sigma factor [bacterium]
MKRQIISEQELIKILRTGEESAFDVLYRNYAPAIFGLILNIVKNREQAEEITQDSFVKIWNNFSTYSESKGRVYTWMLNIARNLAIDFIRSKQERMSQKNQDLEISVYQIDQQGQSNIPVDEIGLKNLVGELSVDQKVIIEKMYFQGYSQSEISEELEIPLGTVKTRARQAIMKLRFVFGLNSKGGEG